MADKEGGDSEKKMTKDFLDRWKKISTKYEGPEDAEAKKDAEKGTNGAPVRTTEEDLDRFLADMADKDEKGTGKGAVQKEQKDLDELLAEFGLEEGAGGAKPRKIEPKAEARPAAPPAASAEDSQKRVLETLKKVGLVGAEPAGPGPEPPKPLPLRPPPGPAPSPGPADDEDEEEDSLMLELEALLSQDGPSTVEAPEKVAEAPRREAFEEEDLIAELEGLLEGSNEVEEHEEAPAPVPVIAKPAAPPAFVARAAAPPPVAPASIEPPRASPPPMITAAQSTRPGRVNGGRVNGGRVNGGRVNGGRVNGGRVNGGRVNGGRVNGGSLDAGRVNGGRVNGGRVNGGRVNGGRVNGGRVNGGRVNGGRVNGGRVNGGRVNGGRSMPRILVQENRRSRMIRLAVAAIIGVSLFAGLLSFAPFGGGPRGPTVDGDVADWAGTGALTYTDVLDSSLPSALDLREYSVRTEGTPAGRLWFEAKTQSDMFSRPGTTFPPRGDLFVLLLDVDGSAATGYAYRDLGVDRVVEVTGWDGAIHSTSTKTFGPRPTYDYAGFEPVGGLQVAIKGDRIEGLLTGIQRIDPGARAAFELRGLDSNGVERGDSTPAPATLGNPSVAAVVTAVSPGILQPGSTSDTPMLSVRVWNPSPSQVTITSLRVTARYAPLAPAQAVEASVWRDNNENGVPEPGGDTKLTITSSALPQQTGTTLSFTGITINSGTGATLLVTISNVPSSLAVGSSVLLSLDAPSDVAIVGGGSVSLLRSPTPTGAQPGAYVASPPAAIAVDGITLDWVSRPSVQDPAADVGNPGIDLTQLAGNATAVQLSVLVSLSSSPMMGAVVPIRLPGTQVVVSQGGGSQGPPAISPPNPGTDFVFVMIEADNDAGTGFLLGGKGYDFAIRVDGKDGQVLPGAAKLLRWESTPSPGWAQLQQVPSVGIGPNAIELGAANPPFALLARNVTLLAYTTDWQGLRDDLEAPLVISNSLGTRGSLVPPAGHDPTDGFGEEPPANLPIPEFQDILVPAAGVLSVIGLSRRRRAQAAEARVP